MEIIAGKTGYLDESKYNFTALVKDQFNQSSIIVLFGAKDPASQFRETKQLTFLSGLTKQLNFLSGALMGACHGRAEGLGVVASERRTRRPGAGRNRPWIGEPRTVGSRHAAWRLPSTLPRGRATLTPRRAQPRQPGAVVSEQDLRTSTRAACPTDSAPAARRRLHRLPPQSPVSATAARPYPSNLGA
jgi:hypothetical protein